MFQKLKENVSQHYSHPKKIRRRQVQPEVIPITFPEEVAERFCTLNHLDLIAPLSKESSILLYLRESFNNLILNLQPLNFVEGFPGSGKSCAMWLKFLLSADALKHGDERLLWISFATNKAIIMKGGFAYVKECFGPLDIEDLATFTAPTFVATAATANVSGAFFLEVVIDGIRSFDLQTNTWLDWFQLFVHGQGILTCWLCYLRLCGTSKFDQKTEFVAQFQEIEMVQRTMEVGRL
jgi:hypothetical protein